jgi:hypothetical protein
MTSTAPTLAVHHRDIRDARAMNVRRQDFVFHLAGHVGGSDGRP